MKRDMDLVRKILLKVEMNQSANDIVEVHIDGYSEDQIAYHIAILTEAGLLENIHNGRIVPVNITSRLTWAGHDFLDACRDEGRWQEAKKIIEEKVRGASFDIIKLVLTRIMESQVDLVFS